MGERINMFTNDSFNGKGFSAESHAYSYAYNEGHSDSRKDDGYNPIKSKQDLVPFKRVLKQKAESFNAETLNTLIVLRQQAAKEEGLEDWKNDSNAGMLSGEIQERIWKHKDFGAESFETEWWNRQTATGHEQPSGDYGGFYIQTDYDKETIKEIFKDWKANKYPYEKRITQDSFNNWCENCGEIHDEEKLIHYQFYLPQSNSRRSRMRYVSGNYCGNDAACGADICESCYENGNECEECSKIICDTCKGDSEYVTGNTLCQDCWPEEHQAESFNASMTNTDLLEWCEDYLWENDKKGYQAYYEVRRSYGFDAESNYPKGEKGYVIYSLGYNEGEQGKGRKTPESFVSMIAKFNDIENSYMLSDDDKSYAIYTIGYFDGESDKINKRTPQAFELMLSKMGKSYGKPILSSIPKNARLDAEGNKGFIPGIGKVKFIEVPTPEPKYDEEGRKIGMCNRCFRRKGYRTNPERPKTKESIREDIEKGIYDEGDWAEVTYWCPGARIRFPKEGEGEMTIPHEWSEWETTPQYDNRMKEKYGWGAEQRTCKLCGNKGHNARTCKYNKIDFSQGGFWKTREPDANFMPRWGEKLTKAERKKRETKAMKNATELDFPYVDNSYAVMITKIVDGFPMKGNRRINVPRLELPDTMKMTWGEIKTLGGKGKDSLTTLGDSTYSSALLAKAFQKLPTDTVIKIQNGRDLPARMTFEYGGDEWMVFFAPRVDYMGAETFEATKGIDTFTEPFEEMGVPKWLIGIGGVVAAITGINYLSKKL